MSALLAHALLAVLQADPPRWEEVRFERLHLRNGNFIDGHVVRQTPQLVTIKLKTGQLSVRTDQIDRIEKVKMRSLKDRPVEIRPERASAPLPDAGAPPRVKPLAKAAPDAPADPRIAARVEALLDELRTADPEQAAGLIDRLENLDGGVPAYLAGTLPHLEQERLQVVVGLLLRAKNLDTAPVLTKHLAHQDPRVRATSALLLGALGDPSLAPSLEPLLGDPEPGVRAEAVTALLSSGAAGSLQAVARACADPDGEVRARAISALGLLARRHGLENDRFHALRDAAERASDEARSDVVNALAATGHPDVPRELARHLRDDRPEVRIAAAAGLATVKGTTPESAAALADAMASERHPGARVQMAAAAGQLRIQAAGGALVEWMQERDLEVVEAAHAALRVLAGTDYGRDAAAWSRWWEQVKPRGR